MARRRMIDPGLYYSRQFTNLASNKPHPQVTYLGTIHEADDYGILELDIGLLRSHIYPRASTSNDTIKRHIISILKFNLLLEYRVDGIKYAIHPNWGDYQKLDHPGKPKHPFPPDEILARCSPKTLAMLAKGSALREGKGRE